jgi:D-alanyl-D-alanine carboxypeptidase
MEQGRRTGGAGAVARRWRRAATGVLVALVLGAGALVPGPAAAAPHKRSGKDRGPQVEAHFAVLVDPGTGVVLWQRNPTMARPPASLTKMLTAITIRASLPMQARLSVTKSIDQVPANALALGAGHRVTVAQALTALMMISANDMAVLLAGRAAGSVPRFSQAMDAQSRRLGSPAPAGAAPTGSTRQGTAPAPWTWRSSAGPCCATRGWPRSCASGPT